MRSSRVEIGDTSVRGRRLLASVRIARLLRMLRSTWARWPRAKLEWHPGGIGVSLDDRRFLSIVPVGDWNAEDLSDWLALFVVWLRAEPERWVVGDSTGAGASAAAIVRERLLRGPAANPAPRHGPECGCWRCANGEYAPVP